jgi:hypothetical protein
MTGAGHIAAGLLIDQHCPPELAFGAGVFGHAAMDYLLPEHRPWPLCDNIPIIAWEAVASYVLLREVCKREERAGVLGQLAPDIVDGVYSLLNPAAWQTGKLLCPWHSRRRLLAAQSCRMADRQTPMPLASGRGGDMETGYELGFDIRSRSSSDVVGIEVIEWQTGTRR